MEIDGRSILIILVIGAFYGAAMICAVREILYGRTPQGSIAWLLSLIFIPFISVFVYLLFGWKKFDDYARLLRDSSDRLLPTVSGATTAAIPAGLSNPSTARWPALKQLARLPFLGPNTAELLIDGEATFHSIFAGIESARNCVLVQFFIIRDDALGNALAERMIERARAGLTVRLLYDDIGSRHLTRPYLERLREAGVEVAAFNKRRSKLRLTGPFRVNFRNHRKVVVVDGWTAWVGGHNVGDEYLGNDPKIGRWRDTHVKVTGPAAAACQLSFAEDWQWATGAVSDLPWRTTEAGPGAEPVLVIGSGPADRLESCAIAFAEAISGAHKRLWIVSPYFVPDMGTLTALYGAALRGVDVRIMLPEKADHLLVWFASFSFLEEMAAHGVSVYRYTDGFLHQKVILVDDALAGIGTANFDNRSFRINFEITLWFTGATFVRKVKQMLDRDFNNCRITIAEDFNARPWYFRLIARAARLFSPVL
jgi:cardiolipin synthase